MMKKEKRLLLLSVFLLFSVLFGYSQNGIDTRNEIYVSYGFFPVGHVTKPELGVVLDYAGGYSVYSLDNQKKSGTINIGYLYRATGHLSLGLSYTYSTVKDEVHQGSSEALADTEVKNHIVLLNVKYSWLRVNNVNFYTRGGLGVKFSSKAKFTDFSSYNPPEQKSEKRLAWQISALGVEWNLLRNMSVFAEGGAGMQGCVMAGVKAHF